MINNKEMLLLKTKEHMSFAEWIFDCGRVYLAGGCILDIANDRSPKDYDFFFGDKASFDLGISRLVSGGYKIIDSSYYTVTAKLGEKTVQFIHKQEIESVEKLIESFDFKNTMCAYDGKVVSVHGDFFSLNEDAVLEINCITSPLKSIDRISKYLRLGYDVKDSYEYIVDLLYSRKGDFSIILNSKYYP